MERKTDLDSGSSEVGSRICLKSLHFVCISKYMSVPAADEGAQGRRLGVSWTLAQSAPARWSLVAHTKPLIWVAFKRMAGH